MIHAFCFWSGNGGWARHAAGFLGALQKLEDVAVTEWDGLASASGALVDDGDPSIGIGPIELMTHLPGSRRNAFVVWETSVIPEDKIRILNTLDEVWTPSHWGRALLIRNGLAEDKVFVVPEGVDADAFRPAQDRSIREPRPFRFLCVGKWEPRKNIEALVQAYTGEFSDGEPVELVLHCFNPYRPGLHIEAQVGRVARRPHAPIVISPPGSQADLIRLYNRCDVFVLPARAEGWGLPIVEAMACGLPPIVTDYSAPTDFVHEGVGYPVRVASMVDVHDPYFFPEGASLGTWAQVDIEHLRERMRHVFENQEEAREKGRCARSEVCQRWTWDRAAAAAYARLRPERFTHGAAS